ncbi:hypothetical protein O0L34_g7508 [Tuta absoluta]|nr:hypothetical protein O0L34_g7508 [Tuta absoluta]
MDHSVVNQFSFNFKEVLLDEIALEGLEGVGFDLLWRRVEKRMLSPVTEKMKARFWGFLAHCATVDFYEIPEALPYVEIKDRFEIVDEETGNVLDPPEYLDGPFTYKPITNGYGSCMHFKSRKLIKKKKLQQIPYDKVIGYYGDKIVAVASAEERWKALAPHMPMNYIIEMGLTATHYCLLELIGKSRGNGQMTIGNTTLTKIVKDSKLLFYNRKFLQKNDLIRVQSVAQVTGSRSVKALLLRLKRFHQPQLLSMPKHGKVHDIAEYLMTQPNYSDTCKNIFDSNVATQATCKRLSKSENCFVFEDLAGVCIKKSKQLKNRLISLNPQSEDDSHSDEETTTEHPCRYQVKVNLMRQAYERIRESGLEGLSQVEVAEMVGLEYYTARTICRTFKLKHIVKEIFVDRGKQRTAKFVAAASASAVDAKYEVERKKFFEYVDESKNAIATKRTTGSPEKSDSDSEVPKKKPKMKLPKGIEEILPDAKSIEKIVSEVKHLDGFENVKVQPFLGPGKGPTMRQLRYANAILKTIQEKVLIIGYMNLNSMASKESNEPLMDNKGLKIMVQKLVSLGQIKLLRMTWPVWHKSCTAFCAPHVQVTDSIVRTKYRELSLGMLRNKRVEKEKKIIKKETGNPQVVTRPLAMSIYPRYLKLQKLHEFLIKMVYFNEDARYHSIAPEGFSSLVDMIPEFTVEFVIGNMSHVALMAMYNVHIPQNMLQQKLRNVPGDLFKTFLATPTLQNGWRLNLKVLSTLGLLQLIKNPTSNDDNYILSYEFYMNRCASIIDTRGDWPRENADLDALRRTYHFNTFADVEQYWKDVYDISMNTNMNLLPEQRGRKQPFFIPRLREEVQENDNGQFYGNGLGPCGFDSTFFMEIPKLWVMTHTKLKHHALFKKPAIKMPKKRKPKPKKVKPTVTSKRKRIVKPPDGKLRRRRPAKTSIPQWTKEEDRILMLCKAAISIISSTSYAGCLRLRNLVAKDILTINDPKKSATNCHKRSCALDTNTTLAYEKDCVINELRRYPDILRRYEGIFKTLRLQYCGQISKVIVTARLPMLELVYIMLQIIRSDNFNKRKECVALNLEDFYSKFAICPSTVNKNFNAYKTPEDSGPVLAAIKEGIIVAVMTTYRLNKVLDTAKKIHTMFSVYPEQTLRPAIEQLRKAGAVAAREKTMNNAIHKFHFQDIAQSSYKLSSNYTRHWICRMNSEFADNLMFSLDDDIPKSDLKGTPEMNCLILESQASDVLDINCVSVPKITGSGGSLLQEEQMSVTEMIMRFKIKPGAVACLYKKNINKFTELFQDLQYETALEALLRQSQVNNPPDHIDDADKIVPEKITDEDKIVSYLRQKKSAGCTFEELWKALGYDKATLIHQLATLESQNIIRRLGYYENLLVLSRFAKPWTITIKDKKAIPTPCLTLDFDIRNDVFLKWAGIIVNKLFVKPGCSIAYLADECEVLTARAAQDICMVLEKCKCVTLKCVDVSEPDLFSDMTMPVCEDFNPYASVNSILVFPVKNILTRYSYLRKKMFDDEYYFEKT